jgi:4-amino-4-deoxy-L-arabinose transferase-like glycosyltransferase
MPWLLESAGVRLVDRRWDRVALVAIAVGAAARAAWILWLHPPLDYLYSDMEVYVRYAADLARGQDLNVYSTLQPQGMHLLLALPLKLLGVGRGGLWGGAALWWVLSAATPFFAWRLARLLLTPGAAAVAAVLAAVWPLHVAYAGYFLSETPSLAFLLAALWLGYRAEQQQGSAAVWQGLLAGALGAFAVATRPQFLLNLALVAVPFLPRRRRNVRATLAFSAAAGVLLTAVVVYNSMIAGRLTGLSREGGVTFFVGQCHVKTVTVRTATTFYTISAPPYVQRGGAVAYFPAHEIWEEGFFYRKGFRCIADEGFGYLLHPARMIADTTATSKPWPQLDEPTLRAVADGANVLYGYALLPLIILIALERIRRRVRTRAGEVALLAHLACIVPVAIVFLGDPRFRAPYDVFGLTLLAAAVTTATSGRRLMGVLDRGRARANSA